MYTLKDLSYSYDAINEVIDAKTMEIHYTKHLQSYVSNFNSTIEGTEFENNTPCHMITILDTLPKNIKTIIRNNAGGIENHIMYFGQLYPKIDVFESPILDKIKCDFGSYENFISEFKTASLTLFGSGWTWLVFDGINLTIKKYSNQDNPLMDGLTPILGIDVWEHAYYLKYQNLRADYLDNIFTILNWEEINKRFIESLKKH